MVDDLRNLSDRDLARRLEQLEGEEHAISRRRGKLHELISYRKTMGNADGTPATQDQLAELDEEERENSRARKDLHAKIENVRLEQAHREGAG